MDHVSRSIAELTFVEVSEKIRPTSVLCLPIGAIEQHGPHLPLNTDILIAEEVARRLTARWGDEFDIWMLPSISVSLSREHDWAPGTLALRIDTFVALLKDLGRELVRSLRSRNLVIVNGHGGNRGVLDNLMHELFVELGLNSCTVHPLALATQATSDDVHGGRDETSVLLAIAPHLVRRERISAGASKDKQAVSELIFDPGASFPWRSDDPRLAEQGAIGDPSSATAEIGQAILEDAVARSRGILLRLLQSSSDKHSPA